MPIWKEQTAPGKDTAVLTPEPATPRKEPEPTRVEPASYSIPRTSEVRGGKESLIASGIAIEGKIEGAGHVRIAGRFKGDVHVDGDLNIESGAKLTGGVRASTVTIGGDLEGNIDGASRVELLATGVLNGDLKAGSLIVAAGSRMRGQVEFGWEDKVPKAVGKAGSGAAA